MFKLARALALVCFAFASHFAFAQSAYPNKPIHLIVAFVPGGATDTFARQISNDLQEALGQPVVIENKPGAGGYIAWNHVASSDPDGYTLLLAENAVAISQALYKKSKSNFDPITQYDAIAGLAASPSALVVANNVPVKSVGELLAFSKTVPQKMNYASAGIGSVSHLNFEVFRDKTGMDGVHVPYKGGGQAIGDVIAGHVPMTITSVQAVKGLVESGKVKALAVTSPERSPALPDVPTMKEAGRAAGRCRVALLVRDFRAEGAARSGQGQALPGGRKSAWQRRRARAAGQTRHHIGRHRRPGHAPQARWRNQELDPVHRRQGHQGGIAGSASRAEPVFRIRTSSTGKSAACDVATPYRRQSQPVIE